MILCVLGVENDSFCNVNLIIIILTIFHTIIMLLFLSCYQHIL